MKHQTEKTLAYCIAAILLAMGIVCYAAYPEKPEEPIRIMMKSTAENVLFEHQGHTSEDGYGIACLDCHHAWDEDPEIKPMSCSECHEKDSEDPIKRFDALHQQCIGCHEDDGTAPTECTDCHRRS